MKSKTRFTFPAIAQNILFYFKQYLVRGAQFSEAGLNGALVKKKMTQKTISDKKWNN